MVEERFERNAQRPKEREGVEQFRRREGKPGKEDAKDIDRGNRAGVANIEPHIALEFTGQL